MRSCETFFPNIAVGRLQH